jgi:hypothetical protein
MWRASKHLGGGRVQGIVPSKVSQDLLYVSTSLLLRMLQRRLLHDRWQRSSASQTVLAFPEGVLPLAGDRCCSGPNGSARSPRSAGQGTWCTRKLMILISRCFSKGALRTHISQTKGVVALYFVRVLLVELVLDVCLRM